jgi:hypothetical protein
VKEVRERKRERESQKRKKIKAYEKVEKSPNTVFFSHFVKSNEIAFVLG